MILKAIMKLVKITSFILLTAYSFRICTMERPSAAKPPLIQKEKSIPDLYELCRRGNLNTVRAIIIANRDRITELDSARSTLLQLAISNAQEHTDLVEFLIERGAPLEYPGYPGYLSSLLISALRRGHNNVAMLLLARGADSNAKDKNRSALHYAAAKGSEALVNLLIAKGADLKARDESGLTPFQIAYNKSRAHIMQLLMEAENKASPQPHWFIKCLASYFETEPSPSDKKQLYHAAEHGNVGQVKSLLANINPNLSDETGITPLHVAAAAGHVAVVQEFLEHKVPVNIQTRAGSTPLHYAVLSGQTAVVRLLVSRDANVNAQDKWGDTPLQAGGFNAEKMLKYQEMIRLLARYGATVPPKLAELV